MIKRQLITDFFKTQLNVTDDRLREIVNEFYPHCFLQSASKYQILETPGPSNGGRVWLSVAGMVHSYYFRETNGTNQGLRIYEKMNPMFSAPSLIDGIDRDYFLQMLEPSLVLSIAYTDIMVISGHFNEVSEHINYLGRKANIAIEHRIRLLTESIPQQVIRFEAENKLFCMIASKQIKAMHLGLSRQAYNARLRNHKKRN